MKLLRNEVDSSRIYVYDAWITNVACIFGKIIFSNEAQTLYRPVSYTHLNNIKNKK